jgi:hypothetical protein
VPTHPYHNAKGERRAGVTWVLGQNLGWNKDALMGWANREGLAGRNIRGERSTAQVAADIGTAAHSMIEAHIHGWDPVAAAGSQLTSLTEEDQAKAHLAFSGFTRWARNNRLVIVGTELFGVDEEYQTGYCLDALAINEENPESPTFDLVDWKSSKGTYSDHFVQVSAYTYFEEKRLTGWLGRPIRFGGAHILRVSKATGMWKHVFWPRDLLDNGWKVFTWARALHEMRPTIESYVR